MTDEDDFDERKLHWWQHWQVSAALAVLCIALAAWVWVLHAKSAERNAQVTSLQERVKTGPLVAPSNVRSIKIIPDRSGPSSAVQLTLPMTQPPELVQLRIDVSFARQNTFRLLIDRKDQGRAGVIHNLLRDSNGELHVAVNTSVLYPGIYQLTIEGLYNRGSPRPVGWITLQVTS